MIRDAELPRDRDAIVSFIDGSQAYEAVFEPNRRLDGSVAAEHLARLLTSVADNQGRMFVAESDGRAVGFAACSVESHGVFVDEGVRRHGYVSEVYVEEAFRGRHFGRALIAACEGHFRSLGLTTIFISVLAGNARAISAYRSAGFADYALEMRKKI